MYHLCHNLSGCVWGGAHFQTLCSVGLFVLVAILYYLNYCSFAVNLDI